MRRGLLLLVVSVAILAVACGSRAGAGQGTAPDSLPGFDQVADAMLGCGADMALYIDGQNGWAVVCGWVDSARHFVCLQGGDSLACDHLDAGLDREWEFRIDKRGCYRMGLPGVPSLVFSVKFSSPLITTRGVEFDAMAYGARLAHCVFVAGDAELSSTTLFDINEVRSLLAHAVGSHIVDSWQDLELAIDEEI